MTSAAPMEPDPADRLETCLRLADPALNPDMPSAVEAAHEAIGLGLALGRADAVARGRTWLARHHVHQGRYQQGLDGAREALSGLPAQGDVEIRLQALHVALLGASELGRFDLALEAAEEMMHATAGSGDAEARLRAGIGMAMILDRMGSCWQAARLLSQALQDTAQAPAPALLMANNTLCAVCIDLAHSLRDIEAEDERARLTALGRAAGERARALLPESAPPAHEAAVLLNLAEILLMQDEASQAEPLLRRAHQTALAHRMTPYAMHAQVNLNDVLLRQGRVAEAADAMRHLLAETGDDAPPSYRMLAFDVAYRACKAAGRHQEALAHLERAERLRRKVTTEQLRAQSELFVTRVEADLARRQAERAQQDAAQERERAERDPLTGLGNRRHLERRMSELLADAHGAPRPLALAQIDVDHFKRVNDTYGHAAGDAVLCALAQLLRDNTRTGDVLVRHGGEEFVVVLPDTAPSIAIEVFERLRQRVQAHRCVLPDGKPLGVTVSIGLAAAPPHVLEQLVDLADKALYAAKAAGRNRLHAAPAASEAAPD